MIVGDFVKFKPEVRDYYPLLLNSLMIVSVHPKLGGMVRVFDGKLEDWIMLKDLTNLGAPKKGPW